MRCDCKERHKEKAACLFSGVCFGTKSDKYDFIH